MRKIEKKMLNAIKAGKNFVLDNTEVRVYASHPASSKTVEVFLHGHPIALVSGADNFVTVNMNTLQNYPTNTTKSRLRALGVNVYTKKGETFINGKSIYS